jgi:hypothetical protein
MKITNEGIKRFMQAVRAEIECHRRTVNLWFLASLIALIAVLLIGSLQLRVASLRFQPVPVVDYQATMNREGVLTAAPQIAETLRAEYKTSTPTSTLSPTITPTLVSTAPVSDGYFWHGKYWIPGVMSYKTLRLSMPDLTIGIAVSYAPGVMEEVARNTGRLYDGYAGAVALELCADVEDSVWLRRPGHDWEGPFLVIDCARPEDLYGNIVYDGIVVEVDYNTAVRWDSLITLGIVVSKLPPGQIAGEPRDFRLWFLQHVEFEEQP